MSGMKTAPLVWVKDKAGNRYFCPMDQLRDPNSLTEEEKKNCVDDASRLSNPHAVPGEGKLHFGKSVSLS
jgi:hypothetical protein